MRTGEPGDGPVVMRRGRGNAQQGFTLVALLVLLGVMGLFLSVAGTAWSERARRDKEAQLLRVGALYANAIARYYQRSPGQPKQYPATLQMLLEDKRFAGVERHMRQLYPDPMNPTHPWQLIMSPNGGIQGVYSDSAAAPLSVVPVTVGGVTVGPGKQYSDWKFIANPGSSAP